MRLIDADALEQAYDDKYTLGDCGRRERDDVVYALRDAPTVPAPRWHKCEDELPNDGEWAIFTNGKVVSVERFKEDAYNHFYPASNWFDFEDAIAWMPLPEPPKEDA